MPKKNKNKLSTGKKVAYTVILAVLVCTVGFLIAVGTGYIGVFNLFGNEDEEVPSDLGATDMGFSDIEIFTALEALTGKDLEFVTISAYIDALHTKMWGINDKTATEVITSFETQYTADGFTGQGVGFMYGSNWVAYTEAFIDNSTNGRAVIAGEGAAINAAYGYDVVVMTGYGPLTTWYQFFQAMQ